MRRANRTIPVLVEEAEGLLELGDLVVGELVRHGRGGGEGSDRSELEAAGGIENEEKRLRALVRWNFPSPNLYALPLERPSHLGRALVYRFSSDSSGSFIF
jgi:hypothetical protein